jgi:hypothetical protein
VNLKSFVSTLKDFQYLIGFLGLTSLFTIANLKITLGYILVYNLHILLVSLVVPYIFFKISKTEDKKIYEKIEHITLEYAKDQLKENVRQLAISLKDVKVITRVHTIKRIYDIEKRRKELGINSYTEETMAQLIERIDKNSLLEDY